MLRRLEPAGAGYDVALSCDDDLTEFVRGADLLLHSARSHLEAHLRDNLLQLERVLRDKCDAHSRSDRPVEPVMICTMRLPSDRLLRQLSIMEALQQDTDSLRRMSPEQKLTVMHTLIRQAWELKAAAVRAGLPALSEPEVRARAWELVGGDRP